MNTLSATLPSLASNTQITHASADLQRDDLLAPLHGPSRAITRLWSQVRVVAPHFRSLLLTGERGCGQENVVHLLQILSPFHAGPLLTLGLTDAAKRLQSPKRLLQSVTGGVLYIPEVDRLQPESQADLLRFIRLNRHHQCALVAFSERDLRMLVVMDGYSGTLAEELGSFSLPVPPLRERREDIPLLAELVLREAQSLCEGESPALSFTPGFLDEATSVPWPGNLDQLRSVMKCLVEARSKPHLLGYPPTSTQLNASDLRIRLAELNHNASGAGVNGEARLIKLDQVVQEHIRSVLIACQGNKLRASEILGISRSTLYRMLDATVSNTLAMLA